MPFFKKVMALTLCVKSGGYLCIVSKGEFFFQDLKIIINIPAAGRETRELPTAEAARFHKGRR